MNISALNPVTLSGVETRSAVDVSVPFNPNLDAEVAEAVTEYLDANPASLEPLLVQHLADETPHAVYDDLPSFTLIFENGLA